MGDTNLRKIKTCDLVKELESREGVERKMIEPHTDTAITVNGPAVVLVIFD